MEAPSRPAKRFLFLCAGLLSLALPEDGKSQRGFRYMVAAVDAKAYLHNQGRFSASLIDNPKMALWNTPIGEGAAGGPSDDTFLEVLVAGPPREAPDSLLLRMVAFTASDTLLDRMVRIGSFNTTGRFYAACWLYDTGCEPITIDVRLAGNGAGPRITKLIPYQCGE